MKDTERQRDTNTQRHTQDRIDDWENVRVSWRWVADTCRSVAVALPKSRVHGGVTRGGDADASRRPRFTDWRVECAATCRVARETVPAPVAPAAPARRTAVRPGREATGTGARPSTFRLVRETASFLRTTPFFNGVLSSKGRGESFMGAAVTSGFWVRRNAITAYWR